jgi:hypothetical protein
MSTGRIAPAYPTITLSSGESIQIRRLATGTVNAITVAVVQALTPDKPQPPVQRVETAPNEWLDVANSSDPDYQTALAAWQDRVKAETSQRLMALIADYAIITPTDDEAVAAYKAALAAVGVTTTETDRQIAIWSIIAPHTTDHRAILQAVLGISEPSREAVDAHRATF